MVDFGATKLSWIKAALVKEALCVPEASTPLWMHVCKEKDISLIILFDCYLPQYLLKATLLIHMTIPLKLLSCTCGRWNLHEKLHAITHQVFLRNTLQKKHSLYCVQRKSLWYLWLLMRSVASKWRSGGRWSLMKMHACSDFQIFVFSGGVTFIYVLWALSLKVNRSHCSDSK